MHTAAAPLKRAGGLWLDRHCLQMQLAEPELVGLTHIYGSVLDVGKLFTYAVLSNLPVGT